MTEEKMLTKSDWLLLIVGAILLFFILSMFNDIKDGLPKGEPVECFQYNDDPRQFYNDTIIFDNYADAFGYKYLFDANLVCSFDLYTEKYKEMQTNFCWNLFYSLPDVPPRTKDMKVVDFYRLTDCNDETTWRCNIYDYGTEELLQLLEPNNCSMRYWGTK